MERIYVRLAPGTSLQDASKKIQAMGESLRRELPPDIVELVLTNVGSPGNARSAMTSPNWGPHMGFIRLALVDREERSLSQRELADRIRAILDRDYPGVECLQWPGGLVASVFSNGYIAPLAVEVRGENLEELDARAHAVAEVAREVPGIRDVWPTLELDYPEVRVDIDREEAGRVGVSARDAAQATLEATLGNINTPSVWVDSNNGQSYYVVTYYDSHWITDPSGLGEIPVRVSQHGAVVRLGAYADIHRSVGPIAIERNHLARAAHVLMQTEGRDIGGAAAELERRLATDPRHPADVGDAAIRDVVARLLAVAAYARRIGRRIWRSAPAAGLGESPVPRAQRGLLCGHPGRAGERGSGPVVSHSAGDCQT